MSQLFYPEPDGLSSSDNRVLLSVKILKQMADSLHNVIQLLESGETEAGAVALQRLTMEKDALDVDVAEATGMRVIEGVFDGANMVGSDGNVYPIPANYASKSRLVEGDLLKLTIKRDGGFLFKQIGPIERQRVVGTLAEDTETGSFVVIGSNDQRWNVLRASVTFYHGLPGDEAVILIPKSTPSTWAAIENIVKKSPV